MTEQISKIEFCVFGNEEIRAYSAIKDKQGITKAEAYDSGVPTQGGLVDKRLGVTDNSMFCDTCLLQSVDCPGHFGHTELSEPVFHFGYLDLVKNILSCVCIRCSKLLYNKNDDELNELIKNITGKNRFVKVKKLVSNIKFCSKPDNNCGCPVPDITTLANAQSGTIHIIASWNTEKSADGEQVAPENLPISKSATISGNKKKINEILKPSRVYDILKNISANDCRILGFDPVKSRPENFIIKNFPIAPVAIRPSIKLEERPSEDALTGKIADIIRANEKCKKQKQKDIDNGEESKYSQDYVQLIQYEICTYIDNNSIKLPKSEQKGAGRPLSSVSERLEGKTGRIRGNLMGKRVDFSARTVITSDPNIGLDELGVPVKIAMNVTFPEIVTPFNIDKLTKLVRNGRDIYPGANFLIPFSNNERGLTSRVDVRYRKNTLRLHYGDIVERHLMDGDPVLFNRQPTLHKMSMMCHRVKVIKDESLCTFRINVNVTTPYNADFDGDETRLQQVAAY